MKTIIKILIIACFSFSLVNAQPYVYYVAPADSGGNDNAAGTISAPWATFNKAFATAQAGDTVYFRGGVYHSLGGAMVANSGTRENPICFFNYPGENPIMDCQLHCEYMNMEYTTYNSAIYLHTKQYIYFRGLTVRNNFMCAMGSLNGAIYGWLTANLRFENMTVHNIGQKAIWIVGGAWTWQEEEAWDELAPFDYDSTYIINCDIYDVADTLVSVPGNGGDAIKTQAYAHNYYHYEGNRIWNYTDDALDNGTLAYSVYINNWIMSSKKYTGGIWTGTEGNGMKLAASNDPPGAGTRIRSEQSDPNDTIYLKVINNIALFCNNAGFHNNLFLGQYVGFSPSNGVFHNNISYRNYVGFRDAGKRRSEVVSDRDNCTSIYRNSIAYGSTLVDPESRATEIDLNYSPLDVSNSNWVSANRGSGSWWEYSPTHTFSDADLVTSDSLEIVARFTAPRQADGSLPYPPPLELREDSPLKGAGTYVGMSDNPDIGWDADYYYGTMSVDSTATDILAFTISQQTAPGTINTGNHTVSIQVAYGTDVTSLTPTITLSYGATIAPTSGTARNFTTPQTYTVTALDEVTTQEWTVTVTVASAPPVDPPTGRRFVRTAGGKVTRSIGGQLLYYED
jgi:hypothetical protein